MAQRPGDRLRADVAGIPFPARDDEQPFLAIADLLDELDEYLRQLEQQPAHASGR